MILGVLKEQTPGERRVAIVPSTVRALAKKKIEFVVETGAGDGAGYPDAAYASAGARIVESRDGAFSSADVLAMVRAGGAAPAMFEADLGRLRPAHTVIAVFDALWSPRPIERLASVGCAAFALDLAPRLTRAQTMDVLSSQASLAGYRAVLLAASHLAKIFPMMMTAAGTLTPARVFIVGAGVAGLQAIATARRLGAVVKAYDVRPAVKDEVLSLGARFVEMPLAASESQDKGGYAKELGEEFYARQRELMGNTLAESDVVITTALVPGKPAPRLVTRDMIERMSPGAVVLDMAAERGGNCELSRPDEVVVHRGVTVLGPTNLASSAAHDASLMFSNNVGAFLLHLVKDGALTIDPGDEITRDTLVAQGGRVPNQRILAALGRAES